MKKIYRFDYGTYDAAASFKVDMDVFTKEHALATLEFFAWNYDIFADPIDEVMRKYAMKAITIATFEGYNTFGVIDEFNSLEGFCPIDGSKGIELISVDGYDFDDELLQMDITDAK